MAAFGQNTRNRGQAVIVRENVLGPAIADTGQWGTQDVGGITEGVYKDDLVNGGKVTILTKNGAINAAAVDHGGLAGLGDDDHPLAALVAGRPAENLTVQGNLIVGGVLTATAAAFEVARFKRSNAGAVAIVLENSAGRIADIRNNNGSIEFFPSDGAAGSTATFGLKIASISNSVTVTEELNIGTTAAAVAQGDFAAGVTNVLFWDESAALLSVAGAITGTVITANTSVLPDADDGAALGAPGTAFSDLALATGAVIDFGNGNYTATHSAGLLTFSGDAKIAGDLFVQGTRTWLDSTSVLIADNHQYLNNGYTADPAQTGGLVVNFDPTTTADTIAAGGFTAGVDAVSNPTVITVGSATFSASDFIQISGSTSNNGLFEVLTHTGTTLTIRGIGTAGAVEDFSQNQFKTETGAGAITKIAVSVMRAGTDGVWETASGSSTGFTFNNIVSVLDSPTFVNLTITSFAADWTNAGRTIADLGIVTTADINGGTIDGAVIGGAVAAAITGTTITANGNVFINQDTDAIALNIDSESTTARALEVRADALTTGDVALLLSNSPDTSARKILHLVNDNASASGVTVCTMQQDGTNVNLNLTTNGAGARSLLIDSAATTGAVIDISNPANTTGDIIRIDDADALTTASILCLKSNSADTGTRSLVSIHNDHVDATGATVLKLTQDSTGLALDADGAVTFNESGADVDSRFEGDTLTHMLFMEGNPASENIALLAASLPPWQAMDRGIFIGDGTTAPTGNPTAGGFLYVTSGALQWRGSSGNVTELAPA